MSIDYRSLRLSSAIFALSGGMAMAETKTRTPRPIPLQELVGDVRKGGLPGYSWNARLPRDQAQLDIDLQKAQHLAIAAEPRMNAFFNGTRRAVIKPDGEDMFGMKIITRTDGKTPPVIAIQMPRDQLLKIHSDYRQLHAEKDIKLSVPDFETFYTVFLALNLSNEAVHFRQGPAKESRKSDCLITDRYREMESDLGTFTFALKLYDHAEKFPAEKRAAVRAAIDLVIHKMFDNNPYDANRYTFDSLVTGLNQKSPYALLYVIRNLSARHESPLYFQKCRSGFSGNLDLAIHIIANSAEADPRISAISSVIFRGREKTPINRL